MDQISQLITLHGQGVAKRKIARLLGLSKNTVKKYLDRITSVEAFDKLSDAEKRTIVYGHQVTDRREQILSDQLSKIIKELGKPGVTRYLLWEEYKFRDPNGLSYGRFCDRIRRHKQVEHATLRMNYQAGYYLMVDFTGKKISWIDRGTGELIECEVLVGTLPYSGYTFACAVASQKQEDFTWAINQCLLYFGGLPKVLLSDNLKSFVKKSNRYEPTFSELCIQFSGHYGVELEATRVGKPKDKASVERHVQIVYNRLYAPLRNTAFYSLAQINEAFREQLQVLNAKNFQGKEYSRKDKFDKKEKPRLAALPTELFEIRKSTQAKVQRNYHVILGEDKHQYSVPYRYIGKSTQIVYTAYTVEIYCGLERIAHHKRDRRKYGYSTYAAHMPEKHLKYLEQRGWDAEYFRKQADQIGPATRWAIDQILASKQLIEQTYNACLGVIGLKNKYSSDRLEQACLRAQTTLRASYGIINNILKNGTDKLPLSSQIDLFSTPEHSNIRGSTHYQ